MLEGVIVTSLPPLILVGPLSINEGGVCVTRVPSVLLYTSANSDVSKLLDEGATPEDGIKGIEPTRVCKSTAAKKELFSVGHCGGGGSKSKNCQKLQLGSLESTGNTSRSWIPSVAFGKGTNMSRAENEFRLAWSVPGAAFLVFP